MQGCDETFRVTSSRNVHELKQHTKNYAHICEVCNKKFATLSRWRTHMVTHSIQGLRSMIQLEANCLKFKLRGEENYEPRGERKLFIK